MTDVPRQHTPDFKAELDGAAEHLRMPVLAVEKDYVEKDYWVTRLRRRACSD